MALLIEQMELRDLIHVVGALLERLPRNSEVYKQIAFWLKSFEEPAESDIGAGQHAR